MTADPHAPWPAVIAGVGSYLPERVLTNHDLSRMVDTTDEWIVTRTGIRERRLAAEGEVCSHMSAKAAQRALAMAGTDPKEVELIIVATITPDMVFPATACLVQEIIGARKAFCFDLEAACSGFLYGLKVAAQFIGNGTLRTALVIGGEKLSAITDWQDRTTCVLFGDGAGAAVLQRGDRHRRGILAGVMGSDGSLAELLMMPAGGSRQPASVETVTRRLHYMKMEGREVFKHAVRCMAEACRQAVAQARLTLDQIHLLIPHQANLRILTAVAERLGLGMDRVYVNLDRVGNMSAASIPVALDEAVRGGRIHRGDKLLLVAFGGGFTWGATVVEW